MDDATLRTLMRAIASRDDATIQDLLLTHPTIATARLGSGATRDDSLTDFLSDVARHVYAGDTALHVAGAAHQPITARRLIDLGARVAAQNRLGATALHYSADGRPGNPTWDPAAQSATIALLIAHGSDPNAGDKRGVTPLHRAVRTRSAAAVRALLDGGADAQRRSRAGSTPVMLATQQTGRSGSGSPAAKAQQAEILSLFVG